MSKLLQYAAIGGVIIGSVIPAGTVSAEDLMDLWKVAVMQDGKFLAARHKFQANQEGIIQTRAQLLPTLSIQYEKKATDQTINESDNLVFTSGSDSYDTTTAGLTLTQSIFDYARWERYDQAELNIDKAQIEFTLARQELLLRLAESYFLVLERADQLKTVLSEKNAMSKHLVFTERKLNSGLGRRVDVEDARARYLDALSKEFELQSRLIDSRYALREIIGRIPGKLSVLRRDIDLQSPLPNDPEIWIGKAATRNLELRAMSLEAEVSQKEVSALRAEHYPTLDLVYTDKNIDTDGSVFGGGSDIDSGDLVLQLNIPIYSGGLTSSKVRQAAEKRYAVIDELNDKRRSVERETQDAFNRVQTAIVQIEALEQSVKAQERLARTKTAGYRTGKNNILEVLDVQQDLSEARLALTKARYDYVLNILRLKFSVGDLQLGDLVVVNGWLAEASAQSAEPAGDGQESSNTE